MDRGKSGSRGNSSVFSTWVFALTTSIVEFEKCYKFAVFIFIHLQLVCGLLPVDSCFLVSFKVWGHLLPIQIVSSLFWLEFGFDCLIRFEETKAVQFVVHSGCSVHFFFSLINSGALTETSTVLIVVSPHIQSPLLAAGYLFFSKQNPSFFNFHTFGVLSVHCRAQNIHQINIPKQLSIMTAHYTVCLHLVPSS